MKKCDEASPSIIFAGQALLFITLEADGIFGSNFVYLCILTWSNHWHEKGDEASTINGQALLVKMLITVLCIVLKF